MVWSWRPTPRSHLSPPRQPCWSGKLVDVFPDGRAIFLTDGIIRTRYRNSLAEPEPLTWNVVHGLEQRGIPAFGPLWDS
jgi:predicted acyl esterase